MKHTVNRTMALAITLLILIAAAVCPVSAQNAPETLLALGDSLTTGYGLDNYVIDGDPYLCDSYINTVAKSLGLEAGSTYINRAVNGATSADLADLLPMLQEELRAADLIVISIGGNDLLRALPKIASIASGATVTDFEQSVGVLSQIDVAGFEALTQDTAFKDAIFEMEVDMTYYLAIIADYIERTSPEARVIFLKQYNPMKGVPAFGAFGDFAGTFTTMINDLIEKNCRSHNYECIDVPSVIDHDALGLTNIASNDIHPNAAGHAAIAKLLYQHLTGTGETETEPITEPITEPATEPETESQTEAPAETMTETILQVPTESETATEAETQTPAKQGCSSVIGSMAVILSLLAAAFVTNKHKA